MKIVDGRFEPFIYAIRLQNAGLYHALEKMPQYNKYAGDDFYIINPFFLAVLWFFYLLCPCLFGDVRIHDFLARAVFELILRRLAESVVDLTMQVTGRTGIQLLLGHLSVAVIAADFIFVHAVLIACPEFQLMTDNPPRRFPNILVHRRRNRADHPAVSVALAHLPADGIRLRAMPKLIPALRVQVAHDFLILRSVAGHHIAIRVDEEGVKAHVAREQAFLTVDIID